MTQNTEQNVRTRDAQIDDLVEAMSDEVWVPDHKSYCEKMILEAEARGAEEQRRKDAGGQEPVGYRHTLNNGVDQNESVTLSETKDCPWGSLDGWNSAKHTFEPVYTRPANVAALEAQLEAMKVSQAHNDGIRGYKQKRINELEAEIASTKEAEQLARADAEASKARVTVLEEENARLKTAQFYGRDEEEGGSEDVSSFFDDHDPGTILEIDGYRHVNTQWALWDGHRPRFFETEDEARAALTREGGV